MLILLSALFAIPLYFTKADDCQICSELQSMVMTLQQKYEDLQTQLDEKNRQNILLENRIQQMEENYKMMSMEKFVNLEKRSALHDQDLKLQLDQRDELGKQLHAVKERQGLNGDNRRTHGSTDSYLYMRDGLSQNTKGMEGLGKHFRVPSSFSHLRTNLTDIQFPPETSKSILPKQYPQQKRHRRQEVGPVGFYALLSATEAHPGTHHTIIFDDVKTNIGSGYNKYTGAFSAPRSGLYFISWTIVTFCHDTVFKQLVHNDVLVGFFETDSTDVCDMTVGTGNVVLQLGTGDVAFVRTHPDTNTNGKIYSDSDHRASSFTGFLVH